MALRTLPLLLLPALAQPFRRKMVEESSPACPGSPSPRHAKCSLQIEFEQPCAEVQAEVVARLRGAKGWRCPKTHPGIYTLISASAGAVRGSRETGPGSTPTVVFSHSWCGVAATVMVSVEKQLPAVLVQRRV